MTANKSFYSFEKTEERGKKSLKKAHHIKEVENITSIAIRTLTFQNLENGARKD